MIHIEAAKMPGFISLMGRMAVAGDNTLDVPDMALNIGGHGRGFIVKETLDWDPTENEDGTLGGSLSLGDDIYIYAVAHESGVAELVASKNITVPDGYTANETRRIGGFHWGRVRKLEQAYDPDADLDQKIIPNSVWDLRHRPKCDPSGMVEVIPDQLWMDIYLNSVDGQSWPNTLPLSQYDAMPISGSEGYALWYDYLRLARNAGKRLPTAQEWHAGAYGVPPGSTEADGRVNTGDHSEYGFECVSCLNIDQPIGNQFQTMAELFDRGDANETQNEDGWHEDDLDSGKDDEDVHGYWFGGDLRILRAGGGWGFNIVSGDRCVIRFYPWTRLTTTGMRCVCDSL